MSNRRKVYTDGNGITLITVEGMGNYVPQNELVFSIGAYDEAIEFTVDNCDIDFLRTWQEGGWSEIRKQWPDFNLDSQAQRWLITQSGGEA